MAWRQRMKSKGKSKENVHLDPEKSKEENLRDILGHICRRNEVSDKKKVSYISLLISLLQDMKEDTDIGLRLEELFLCLRIPLTSPTIEVRIATIRAFRFLIQGHHDVLTLTDVHLHLLLIRSIDLDIDNTAERVQAIKMARQILHVGYRHFPPGLVRPLQAIVQQGSKEKGKESTWQVCVAILCELSSLNPDLFLSTGCVRLLTASLLDCFSMPRVSEAVIGSLLRLYNIPLYRARADIDLSILVAPFTELNYVHSGLTKSEDSRVECSVSALLSLLHSWTGLLHLSSPSLSNRPLKSLMDILYLPSYKTRQIVIDLLYHSLSLQVPEWTDEFEVAMRGADPSNPHGKTWKLTEGFVAAEGWDLVPHLAKSRPNLVENHTSLLLSCYLQSGLIEALIEVIVTSDTVLSVRACVLLGQFLHLVSTLLPHEISATVHCLPLLNSYISLYDPVGRIQSNRASAAVTALNKLHCLKKKGLRPSSLLLEQMLDCSGQQESEIFIGDRAKILPHSLGRDEGETNDSKSGTFIKDTGVIAHRDPQSWNWDLILPLLKWPPESLRRLEDSSHHQFLKKVTDYYLPSSNMFSRMELDSCRTRFLTRVGCCLLDFLLSCVPVGELPDNLIVLQLIDSLLSDVTSCIEEVIQSASPHDCVFSPTRLTNTASQFYFLFLGRLSHTETGRNCLDRHNILCLLKELLGVRHEIYLKLVVSCLDYRAEDWGARTMILSQALTQTPETGRTYATQWLGVLARARAPSVAVYGVELLVRQLKDESLQVAATALRILDEISDDKMYLESLVSNCSVLLSSECQSALKSLGDRGRLLLVKCVGSLSGLSLLNNNNWLQRELDAWSSTYNIRYVMLVENMISDGFSRHQRDEDGYGSYGRRTGNKHSIRNVFVPPHLYGQLAQTRNGLDLLLCQSSFLDMVARLQRTDDTWLSTGSEDDWLDIKSAVWCVAHVATSPLASTLLEQKGVLGCLVNIAEFCPVLTVKGTAYYALGLVATTRPGAAALGIKGWATVRHRRGDTWPVSTDWLEQSDTMFPSSPTPLVPSPAQSDAVLEEGLELRNQECSLLSPSPGNSRSGKKISSRLSSWFRNSVDNGKVGDSNNGVTTSGGKSSRRNSEGSRGFSSGIARSIRQSLRRKGGRQRTVSAGDKKETTEGSEVDIKPSSSQTPSHEGATVSRRLSWSRDECDSGEPLEMIHAPSPGETLPGEIFMLQDIVEESEKKVTSNQRIEPVNKLYFRKVEEPEEPNLSLIESGSCPVSETIDILGHDTDVKSELEDHSLPRLEEVEMGGTPTSHSMTSTVVMRGEGVMLGVIKPGTSVSSVSSVGSYTLQDNPRYGGHSRLRRRRPQLSESEDGDTGSRVVARQDSYERSFSRNTFPGRGRHKGVVGGTVGLETSRSVSVPPNIYGNITNTDSSREPSYWGIAFPLRPSVLLPSSLEDSNEDYFASTLHVLMTIRTHDQSQCLACYTSQPPTVRPRAVSMTNIKSQDPVAESSSSHKSLDTIMAGESPADHKEVIKEVMDLVCIMNNSVKSKQAEQCLVRIQRKCPLVFKDLCFYSDVCHVLEIYSFRLNARRFIQELFLEVDFSKMDQLPLKIIS